MTFTSRPAFFAAMSALVILSAVSRYIVMWTEVVALRMALASPSPLSLGSTMMETLVVGGGRVGLRREVSTSPPSSSGTHVSVDSLQYHPESQPPLHGVTVGHVPEEGMQFRPPPVTEAQTKPLGQEEALQSTPQAGPLLISRQRLAPPPQSASPPQ